MDKGCPKCGSKKLISEEVILVVHGRDGRVHPGRKVTLYKCGSCGWQGGWNQLTKILKNPL